MLGRRGADLAGDEVAGRAALRRPAHDLVADVGYRQHVPGYAGRARLGRQDGNPLSRQVVDDQRGRQNLYLQAARRRDVLQRQEVHRRRRHLQLQAAEGSRHQGALRLARRRNQGTARARSLYRRVRAQRTLLRTAAAAHHVHQRDPQSGERGDARQGLRHQGNRRHRAVVLRELAAAHRNRAEAPRRLQMGPVDVQEQGPGEIREAQHQDRARGRQPRRRHHGRAVRSHPPGPAAVHRSRSRPRPT